ncbi:MAG: ParB/RepB/Spo0J family partition protein [Deltaproteobacteria bacterium]|nr:ParB/RepB/Spo0J family partition protein [Deltaproteobacteria bacterium]
MTSKAPLGKGLQALIPNTVIISEDSRILSCGIEDLRPGTYQARKTFTVADLQELINSISESGIIQPLLVRKVAGKQGYEIIAGERRWRAAQKAGLQQVPVIVKSFSDAEAAEVSLLENLQRENLNPIEEAEGFERLIREFGNTHESLAKRLGKDRSTITNSMRLLKLPEFARRAVAEQRISAGHARCLIGCSNTEIKEIITDIEKKGLSVRAVESWLLAKKDPRPAKISKSETYANDVSTSLSSLLHTKVQIIKDPTGGKGKLLISFASNDELDNIIKTIRNGVGKNIF